MKLVHYSDQIIDKLTPRDYCTIQFNVNAKPYGLWFSVEGEDIENTWKDWCLANGFQLESLTYAHQITLKEDANILHLKTAEEIFEFTKSYPYLRKQCDTPVGRKVTYSYELDWSKVKTLYQGIIISPYQWDCRLHPHTTWYYGWDCSSGCLWDLNCIKEFKKV
jgi:hypothetical protein